MSTPGKHPFFDDRRAIHWHLDFPAALEQARSTGKRVFVCIGGKQCQGTRALIERTIWKDEIAEFLNQYYVSVAIDPAALHDAANAADPGIAALVALVAKAPKHEPTPLCLYLGADADGSAHLLHSTAGARPPAVILNDMLEAHNRK